MPEVLSERPSTPKNGSPGLTLKVLQNLFAPSQLEVVLVLITKGCLECFPCTVLVNHHHVHGVVGWRSWT